MIPGGIKPEHVVFSLKTFAAGMLAYWIALVTGLDNPYWALGTVYIVMTPLAGALTSKAIYRLAGTALGALVIVLLVPSLVGAPVLLCMAMALWCGLCLFVSCLDHSPRSYVFLLAGYTVTLTGFTLVTDPGNSFHLAVSRVEEIGVGILCAAILGRIIQPRPAGPLLAQQVEGWLATAADLTQDVLARRMDSAAAQAEGRKLAAGASSIRQMTADVRHEGAQARPMLERMQALQYRMVEVLPLLAEIDDLLSARENGTNARPGPLVAKVQNWLSLPEAEALEPADGLLAEIDQTVLWLEAGARDWDDLLDLRLARRLRSLVEVWLDCRVLRADIATGETHELRHALATNFRSLRPGHTDLGMALRCAASLVAVILLTCAFWIYSGWPPAVGTVQIASILCSVLAMMDNPGPVLKKLVPLVLAAFGLSTAYQFALLPMLDGFVPLAAALGLLLIPCGVLLATPATWFIGFQISVNFIYMMTFSGHAHVNFAPFIAAGIATILGVAAAAIVMATMRAVTAEHSASRLLQAGWDVVIDIARARRRVDPDLLRARMLDRLAQAVPRLARLPEGSHILDGDILRDLRIGLIASRLQRERAQLSDEDGRAVAEVLEGIARRYEDRRKRIGPPNPALREAIDHALRRLHLAGTEAERRVRDSLVGLRSATCPAAAPPRLLLSERRMSA